MKHSKVEGGPIGGVLDNIASDLTSKLLKHLYNGDESKVSTFEYLGAKPVASPVRKLIGVEVKEQGDEVIFTMSSIIPKKDAWLSYISGHKLN